MLNIGDSLGNFALRGINERTYVPEVFEDAAFLVVVFWCNHCPTAKAYTHRLRALVRDYEPLGFRFLAVNANDQAAYPEDSFVQMKQYARSNNYNFAYVEDPKAELANRLGAEVTPHIFIFDQNRTLVYKGGIDDNWKDPHLVRHQYLRNALTQLAKKVPGPFVKETSPFGCSIKRAGNG